MGSLCNFRLMGHPHHHKFSSLATSRQVLYPFNRPSRIARLSRTGNRIPCLVLAQQSNNNRRNPEEKLGSSSNSGNVGGNGVLSNKEKAEQIKMSAKHRRITIPEEVFVIVVELLDLFVSIFMHALETLKKAAEHFTLQNVKYIFLALFSYIHPLPLAPVSFFQLSIMFFFYIITTYVKILAVGAIIGFAYVLLFK